MAYIPTIHTFKDDLEENRIDNGSLISGGTEDIYSETEILQPADTSKKSTKIILISVSIFFLIASIFVVGYYLYNKKQVETQNRLLNQQATQNLKLEKQRAGIIENIKNILPLLFVNTKIENYVSSIILKDKVILLKISRNINEESNYSLLYSLILANEKYLKQDLIDSFKLGNIQEIINIPGLEIPTATEIISSSTDLISTTNNILKDLNDINFINKTTNNQDYKIADTGTGTLIYGYVGDKYFIAATTIKDFLEAVKNLKQ